MLRPLAVLLFAIVCSSAVAEGLSDKKLQKIAAIDYRGIGFSSTQQDLLKTLPNAKLKGDHPGSDIAVLTYEFRDDPAIDCVLFRFFDDALVEIKYFYFPTRLAAMGGAKPLTSLAVEEYGSPTMRANEKLLWDYPTIDRMIVVASENGQWSMSLLHRLRRLGIPDYKDASAVPKKFRMHVAVGRAVPDGHASRRHEKTPRFVMEAINMEAITRAAKHDHPSDYSTQYFVINNQVRAYEELSDFRRPRDMPTGDYANLRNRIAKDHPADYSTQAFVLKNQLQAYTQLTATNIRTRTSVKKTPYRDNVEQRSRKGNTRNSQSVSWKKLVANSAEKTIKESARDFLPAAHRAARLSATDNSAAELYLDRVIRPHVRRDPTLTDSSFAKDGLCQVSFDYEDTNLKVQICVTARVDGYEDVSVSIWPK